MLSYKEINDGYCSIVSKLSTISWAGLETKIIFVRNFTADFYSSEAVGGLLFSHNYSSIHVYLMDLMVDWLQN